MGGEERDTVLLVPRLICIEHPVEPREQLLGAVISVKDDRDAILRGDGADVVGGGDSTGNGRGLVLVVDAFAAEVGSTSLGELEDDGGFGGSGRVARLVLPSRSCRSTSVAHFAASSAATAVEELVTLMAGMAKFFSCAYLNRFFTSSP